MPAINTQLAAVNTSLSSTQGLLKKNTQSAFGTFGGGGGTANKAAQQLPSPLGGMSGSPIGGLA